MPIQGNGMHGPTPPTKAAEPAPKPAEIKAPETKTEKPVDPITAAVNATLGKTEPTVNHAAKEDEPKKSTGESPVAQSDEGVVFDPDMPRDDLEKAMLARIHPPEKPAYIPPPPNERMMGQLEAEQEAGRKRIAYNEQQNLRRPKPEHDPTVGTNVEVRRSGDYQHERNPNKGQSI